MIYKINLQTLSMIGKIISRFNYATRAGRKLYETARLCLGQDIAPLENEFGCAEAVNNVVFKAFGDYAGGDLSTLRMYHVIRNNKKFVQVYKPRAGDIILSPTGMGNGYIPNGHTGIMVNHKFVMSNSSKDGKWRPNYTIKGWRDRYERDGGFPVLFFRRVVA